MRGGNEEGAVSNMQSGQTRFQAAFFDIIHNPIKVRTILGGRGGCESA